MTSRIGKQTAAILAFIALALSVIVPLSVPKAFSAPDCHRAEAGDYGAKIDKVVSDFTAEIKKDGSYGYRIHNGRLYSSDLDSIVTGFGEGREIYEIIKKSKYSLEDILGEGAFWNGVSGAIRNEDGTTTSNGSFGIFSPKKIVDEAKLKEVITSELAEFLKAHPRQICPGECKNAEVKDFEGKIDKMVSDLAAKVKGKGEYVYGSEHFPELNSIAPGFGMYREITKVIKGNGYTFEDILGEGSQFKAVPTGKEDIHGYPKVEIHLTSPTKTFDEAKFKDAVSKELAKFLKEHPREICEPDKDEPIVEPTKPSEPTTKPTGDNPKPGCKKAEVKDYSAGIEKVVAKIESSKYEEKVTGGDMTPEGGQSFLRIFTHYEWDTAILRQVNPAITGKLILTEEQTEQVFGDGAKPKLTALGPAPAVDEHGNSYSVGEGSETFHAENATKFDREAMTKIITDEVSEFLTKNPQEICEEDSETTPGDNPKPGCKKAVVGDYAADIEKLVKRIGEPISGDNNYLWAINQKLGADYKVKIALDLTDEQLKQVFGDSAKSSRSMTGPAIAIDENDKTYTTGGPTVYFGVNNATKFDRAAMTKIVTDKVSEFLAKNPQEICEGGNDPKPGDNPKPGCKKAEIKDYKGKIEQEVEKIDKSKRENYYSWSGLLLNNIVPALKVELELTREQTEQVFGKGAIAVALGVPTIDDPSVPKMPTDHDWLRISRVHVDHATKFDRGAMTKIITDKVAEFLSKNPQEICESGSDTKPGTTEPTEPGTDEPTTEPTKPGTDEPTKPGKDDPTTEPTNPDTDEPTTEPTKPDTDTKPGDAAKPGTDEPTEPGTDSKADAEPADTGIDTSEPAVSDSKTGSSSATDSDSNPVSGAATSPEGEQTVLEGATEAGGLATTGAVGLIALGVAVVLIGAGAFVAIRRRKQDV